LSTGGRVQLRAGVASDTGRVRSINQDSYVLLPDQGLWVVADGMGGAQGGEVASRLAIETIRTSYHEPTAEALADAMAEANRRIHEAASDPGLRGMGTTTVAIALVPEEPDPDDPEGSAEDPVQHLLVINVGDSRAYLYRDGSLVQITEDHSVVAELVRDGRITEREAEAHPQRNIITRVLGVYPEVKADLWPVDPIRGDRYLLCSDGLFNEVGDDQMAAVLRRLKDPSDAAAELVRLANEGGGRDNITVIVLDVVEDGGTAERASRALGTDLAGIGTARRRDDRGLSADQLDGVRDKPKGRRGERRAARKAARAGRTRLTWRVLLFTVLLLGVLGGAVATIQWYGTSTYFVAFDGDEVAIYQGRPGGLLWIDPSLEDDTGILRDEVPDRYLPALAAGHEVSSLAQARRYVSNIERDIAESTAATTTTTTTTAPVTPSSTP
jgi:protein phosphatase